jgi:hypothetical protein
VRLVLHIVRKDFRRLRWPLAGWLVIVVARLGIGFSLVLSGGFGGMSDDQLNLVSLGLLALGLLLTFVLTAMLVQEDALVGETQFWLTRPISGSRLLGGKLAGWFLLLWLPAFVVTLPWWLTCGFGVREIFWAALQMFALQLAVSAPAALVAVVTDTLSRFLLWAFVLVFAVGTTPVVLMSVVSSHSQIVTSSANMVTGLVALLLTAVGVIVRQYRRRDVVRSVAWLGVGAALSVFLAVAVPGGLVARSFRSGHGSDWHAERAKGVTLALHSFDAVEGRATRSEVWLHSRFEVKGLPPELALNGGDWSRQTWHWPGGPVITREGYWTNAWDDGRSLRTAFGAAVPKPDEETEKYEAQQRAIDSAKFTWVRDWRSLPSVHATADAELLPSMLTRIRRTAPAYEATVQLRLQRPEIWLEVPLNAVGWHAQTAHGMRVGRVSLRGSLDASVPLVVTMPDFIGDDIFERNWFSWRNREGLYFVHRAEGDVTRGGLSSDPRVTIGSVGIHRETLPVWLPKVRRGDKWVLRDPNWLAGVTLAMVGFSDVARFTAEVKAERYGYEAKNN